MALVFADRVKETTTTTSTSDYVLAGAVNGFQTFAAIGNGNTTYYVCTDDSDFEIGIGTYSTCLLYTSPSPRDRTRSRMPSSA